MLYVLKLVKISAVLGIRALPKWHRNFASIVSASALHARCESF
jgi:hypothetical protein